MQEKIKPNILIISPFFPPDKTVASLRMGSLSNYLSKKGYNVAILTNKRTQTTENIELSFFYVDASDEKNISFKKQRLQTKKNKQNYEIAFRNVVSKFSPNIILISGSPFYNFDLAKTAKEMNIPVILDFRDPWIFDFRGIENILSTQKIYHRLHHFKDERNAIKNASAVVMVTEGWCNNYKKIYSPWKDKFYVIENGFDEEALSKIPDKVTQPNETFTIGVFGKFAYYSKKYTLKLLTALSDIGTENVKILQIGDQESIVEKLMDEKNLDHQFFSSTGFIDYTEGIRKLKQMDAFLIVDNRMNALGTKIYDYIYVNKPIIYIGPKKSQMAKLVGSFQHGYICETRTEIIDTINTLIQKKPECLQKEINLNQYSRRRQNEKYEELILKTIETA